MRWFAKWLNRLWFCPLYGHVWAGDWIEFWIEDFHGQEFHCIACGHKQSFLDIEVTGIRPYKLDN